MIPTTKKIDINCDMGEGIGNDELIMPFVSSANIACGKHAGDETTIRQTVLLAKKYSVKIGAHPSFDDKINFGRTEMNLAASELYNLVYNQIKKLAEICLSLNTKLNHVKPHGALYNLSARDAPTAALIAQVVKDFDDKLVLFGLSGSHSIREAKSIGLKTASEVFADRTYQDNGSLTPRTEPHALITSEIESLRQVMEMIKEGMVHTISGKKIKIIADTICIHGDGAHAVKFAKNLYEMIVEK